MYEYYKSVALDLIIQNRYNDVYQLYKKQYQILLKIVIN